MFPAGNGRGAGDGSRQGAGYGPRQDAGRTDMHYQDSQGKFHDAGRPSAGVQVNKTSEQELSNFVHRSTPRKPFIYKDSFYYFF